MPMSILSPYLLGGIDEVRGGKKEESRYYRVEYLIFPSSSEGEWSCTVERGKEEKKEGGKKKKEEEEENEDRRSFSSFIYSSSKGFGGEGGKKKKKERRKG